MDSCNSAGIYGKRLVYSAFKRPEEWLFIHDVFVYPLSKGDQKQDIRKVVK